MPELPEVETVAAGLAAQLAGDKVRECVLNRSNMRFPFPDDLQEVLSGATVIDVYRRAKYLIFNLDNGYSVLAHLGMSGTMRVVLADTYEPRKHDHVLWDLASGRFFVFNDPRRFGLMLLSESNSLHLHPLIASLGIEPLGEDFTSAYLEKAMKSCSSAIKVAIMDQKLVVGVGNIYASEALFRAEIHPQTAAKSAASRADRLVPAIQSVLREAIASGGSTLRDYVRSDGDLGYFQHHFAVYGRNGEPCIICATPISQIRQAGRSSFYCKTCQPL